MKKLISSRLFYFILGVVISCGITTAFAYSFFADDVNFTPTDTSWDVDNVQKALDELYKDVTLKPDNIQLIGTRVGATATISIEYRYGLVVNCFHNAVGYNASNCLNHAVISGTDNTTILKQTSFTDEYNNASAACAFYLTKTNNPNSPQVLRFVNSDFNMVYGIK